MSAVLATIRATHALAEKERLDNEREGNTPRHQTIESGAHFDRGRLLAILAALEAERDKWLAECAGYRRENDELKADNARLKKERDELIAVLEAHSRTELALDCRYCGSVFGLDHSPACILSRIKPEVTT